MTWAMVRVVAAVTAALSLGIAAVAAALAGWLRAVRIHQADTVASSAWDGFVIALVLTPPVVAVLTTLVLRQSAMSRLLRAAALTDPLTGIPNRRAFFEATRRWLDRPGGPPPFGLLMIDVDHFKAVNDRLGHEAGDVALRHVARTLQGVFAGGRHGATLLARLGGEEFAAFLSDVTPQATRAAAAEAVASMRDSQLVWGGETLALRVSVGVWWGEEAGIDRALAEADDAVYRAKAAGRDRWVEAAAPGREGPSRVRRRAGPG